MGLFRNAVAKVQENKFMLEESDYGTGYPGKLTEHEAGVLERLKGALRESHDQWDPRWDDTYLLRFCRARKFDFDAVWLMFSNMLKWRKENKVDGILEEWSFQELEEFKKLYPHGFVGVDCNGRPVYVSRLNFLDKEKFLKVTTEQRYLRNHIANWEHVVRYKLPAAAAKAGRPVSNVTVLIDAKDVSLWKFNSISGLLSLTSKSDQDYYPEYLYRMYIFNCPSIFSSIWWIVRSWLDPKVQRKISLSSKPFDTFEHVPKTVLPEWMGGSNRADNQPDPHGVHLCIEQKGPWTDKEWRLKDDPGPNFYCGKWNVYDLDDIWI